MLEQWNELNGELESCGRRRARRARGGASSSSAPATRGHIESADAVPAAPGQRLDYTARQQEALRAVEDLYRAAELPESGILRLEHVVRSDELGDECAYIEAASSPAYRSAWGKYIKHGAESFRVNFSEQEREAWLAMQEAQMARDFRDRAAGLSGPAGGYAVPVVLDPSVIPVSSFVLNPLRSIARVETVVGAEWRGVTSTGVTAAFQAEAEEVSETSPPLLQPTAHLEMARSFCAFSIEIGQDWAAAPGAFETEMAKLFAEAKDELEAEAFLSGTGHDDNLPEGLLVGATAILETSAATTIGIGDVYGLKEALPQRFQPRAKFLAADTTLDRVRRLVGPGNTSEPAIWDDAGPLILRKAALEHSQMPSAYASGASVLCYGDFTQFVIADRIGMSVELIPHLFGTARNMPTGQRGLFAYWRTTSKVLAWNAFRTLKLK